MVPPNFIKISFNLISSSIVATAYAYFFQHKNLKSEFSIRKYQVSFQLMLTLSWIFLCLFTLLFQTVYILFNCIIPHFLKNARTFFNLCKESIFIISSTKIINMLSRSGIFKNQPLFDDFPIYQFALHDYKHKLYSFQIFFLNLLYFCFEFLLSYFYGSTPQMQW